MSIEEKLTEVIEVLPLIPAHAPSRLRRLGHSVSRLLLDDLSLADEERAQDAIRDYVLSRGAQDCADRALGYLVDLSALSDDHFPHGLIPPTPRWPAAVTTFPGGESLADRAFRELHRQGWAKAAENFRSEGNVSLAQARAARDAKVAFAKCAVGSKTAAEIVCGWRTYVLYQLGPGFAEQELGPAESWRNAEDFTYANNIAKRYITEEDWESADRVTQDMLNWHGETVQSEKSLLEYKLRRIAKKKFSAAPQRPKTSRPKGSRPTRRAAAPAAPPRPEGATRILREASTKPERDFVASLAADDRQRCVRIMHELPEGGSNGHLWLLFELDNQWVNGQILKHPAVDGELRTWILRQARHGKNLRPGLSSYVDLMAKQRIEFAHEVLRHCDDETIICAALKEHARLCPPGTAIALAKRSLSMPATPAIAILDAISEHCGDQLPDDVSQLLERARHSAAADQRPDAELEGALDEASARYPGDITTVAPDQSADDLTRRLAEAHDASTIEDALHRWHGDLPWAELGAAIDDGKFVGEVIVRLARRPAPPAEIMLHAIRHGRLPRTNSPRDTWRWLDATLSASHGIDDDALRVARVELAKRLILDDPEGLRQRIPADEWREVATRILLIHLGAFPVGSHLTLQNVEPSVLELGGDWIRDEHVNVNHIIGVIPLPIACRLWFTAYPDDEAAPSSNVAGEPIPMAIHHWLEGRLTEPERGFNPSVIDAVRAAVSTWSESLRALVGFGEELQDEVEFEFEFEFE